MRDQVLALSATGREAPLLSVIGGKTTTNRRLAEAGWAGRMPHWSGQHGGWTAGAACFPWGGAPALVAHMPVAQMPAVRAAE